MASWTPSAGLIATFIDTLIDAWNRGDEPAFGARFGPEASDIDGEGHWWRGRRAIEALRRGSPVTSAVLLEPGAAIRIHPPAASLVFRWTSDSQRGVCSGLAIGRDGQWSIESLQNSDVRE